MAVVLEELDAVVISLERTPNRLASFRQRFQQSPIPIQWLPGIDGVQLDVERLQQHGVMAPSALS